MARGRRFVRGAPRSMQWFGSGITSTVLASSATLLGSLNAAALAARSFTIVRTRLAVTFGSDQLAASEGSNGVFSMQVVSEAASAAGIASVPTPLTETDADYFVYKPVQFDMLVSTAVGFEEHRGDGSYHQIDSKAMRKVGSDDDVVLVLQQRVATGAIISVEGRFLVKLH